MTTIPYTFLSNRPYQAEDRDETIRFTTPGFWWKGKAMDWLGSYRLENRNGLLYLDLEYNYAREATFQVIVSEATEADIIAFTLVSRSGRRSNFHSLFHVPG